jgi:diadenosine tetraphosphate (Ap4A) HIT family hydrolase
MTYDKENIFAKIIRGEIPSKKVYEDEKVFAFHDIHPQSKVHILVIPKGEYISFDDFVKNATNEEVVYFFKKVQEIAESQGVSKTGYRLMTNHGKNSGQLVFHFHVHILG